MSMENNFRKNFLRFTIHRLNLCLLAVVVLLGGISSLAAQSSKKKKKDDAKSADSSKMIVPMSDEQQIDYMLSEMLGAWQIGDIEKLHAAYADDVSMVSVSWAPPVIGWANYLPMYQQQRTHMQRIRMDRSNTYVKVIGNMGWACYQWDFSADVDGQPTQSQGQTTVVVEKRSNRWIIVHNHTSLAPTVQQPAPANPTAPQPTPKPAAL